MSDQRPFGPTEPVPRAAPDEPQHWLVRPDTIKRLWWGSGTILALTVVAQVFIKIKGYFGVDDWLGFGAVYGFVSCLIMVLVAKALGFVLKRDESYYQDELKGANDGS